MGVFGKIKKGLVFIISAPAGAGKTTLVEMLLSEYPSEMKRSISCTTRTPRGSEKDGIDYFFINDEEFKKKIKEGAFLEYAKVFNHYYGTLKETVFTFQNEGKHVFLVIDTQGALQLKKDLKAVFVFITPPDIDTLRRRMHHRHTETEDVINLRISYAKEEIEKAKYYDYIIMNDDLKKAYNELKTLVEEKEKESCEYI